MFNTTINNMSVITDSMVTSFKATFSNVSVIMYNTEASVIRV